MYKELVQALSKWPVAAIIALLISAVVALAVRLETLTQQLFEAKTENTKIEMRCTETVRAAMQAQIDFTQAALARQQQIEAQLRAALEKKRR